MDTRPTLDPQFKVKATRPGWKAGVVLAAFFAVMAVFFSSVEA